MAHLRGYTLRRALGPHVICCVEKIAVRWGSGAALARPADVDALGSRRVLPVGRRVAKSRRANWEELAAFCGGDCACKCHDEEVDGSHREYTGQETSAMWKLS